MKKNVLLIILVLLLCCCAALAEEAPLRVQFEDGVLAGGAKVDGMGSRAWVSLVRPGEDSVTLTVETPEEGFFDLTVCSAGVDGRKESLLSVDGETLENTVAENAQFGRHTISRVFLSAGKHEFTVTASWGRVSLDFIELNPSEALPENLYEAEPVLSNPAPSAEAQALMDWMCEVYGKKMISGQYLDEGQRGNEIKAIEGVTGLRPALLGLDMLNYSPTSVSLGTHPISVDQAIDYWQQGHIITMCWHWVAPKPYVNTKDNSWWGGFYTENTTFDLKKAMSGEDPQGYDLLVSDMDAIAEQLKRLRDAGVPILWRPLHEASGGWFWWGASGAEPYKQLYRLMYDRFVNVHGLNNLIWVWNGQNAAWYPGDDVVDVIGEDLYPGNHIHSSQSEAFLRCRTYTEAKKLILLTECGCVPSPEACERDGAMWSSWAVWCYEFVLKNGQYSEDYTSAEDLKAFYQMDNVVTLRDVPDFGRKAAEGEKKAERQNSLTWSFAESAVLSGNARKSGDTVELWGNEENDKVALTVSVPEDGDYHLVIVQAGIGGGKENYLYIDGELKGNTVVSGEAEEACDFGSVSLTKGEHEIVIGAFWGWVRLNSLALLPENAGASETRYEFEDGVLLGQVKVGGFGQDSYVELASNDENDGVSVTVTVPADGYYDLTILQNGIGGYKENYLAVDGERIGNTVVQGTEKEACVTGPVFLTAGDHTITVTCFWGWAALDALIVAPAVSE